MAKASASGAGDSRFESWRDRNAVDAQDVSLFAVVRHFKRLSNPGAAPRSFWWGSTLPHPRPYPIPKREIHFVVYYEELVLLTLGTAQQVSAYIQTTQNMHTMIQCEFCFGGSLFTCHPPRWECCNITGSDA